MQSLLPIGFNEIVTATSKKKKKTNKEQEKERKEKKEVREGQRVKANRKGPTQEKGDAL